MPTPEQVEAVARKIAEGESSRAWHTIHPSKQGEYLSTAREAIAAYEATLPKASTDDGMAVLKTFRDAYNDQALKLGLPTSHTHTQGEAMCQSAGAFAVARAVQARLEGGE